MSHALPASNNPTPILSLDDLHPHQRRGAMTYVTWSWVFGAVWATTIGGAPFTLFAHGLGATEWHFGLLVAMPFIATLLSLPASLWIDASGARKKIFISVMLLQRLTWLGIAIVPTLMYRSGSPLGAKLALVTFLTLMAVHYICGAVGTPAWVSWMADLVPDRVRGRYFARRRQWGIVTSMPAAWLAGVILDTFGRHGSPYASVTWAAVLFGVTTIAGIMDIVMFMPVPHVPPQRAKAPVNPLLTLWRPLTDKKFVWFCLYVAVLTMAVAPMGQFSNLYLVEKLHISATQVQLMMLVAPLLGQFLIVPIWGRMADRFGRKPMMAISTFGLVPVGLGWCAMNLGLPWLGYVLAVSGAMLWAAVEIANFNLVLEMSGSADAEEGQTAENRGSGYMSINSVISAIAGVAGGLGAAWLMRSFRDTQFTLGLNIERPFGAYELLFAASASLRLVAGVIFLPGIHESKTCTPREAIGFVAGNLYNNVVGIVRGPVRSLSRVLTPRAAPAAAAPLVAPIRLSHVDDEPGPLTQAA